MIIALLSLAEHEEVNALVSWARKALTGAAVVTALSGLGGGLALACTVSSNHQFDGAMVSASPSQGWQGISANIDWADPSVCYKQSSAWTMLAYNPSSNYYYDGWAQVGWWHLNGNPVMAFSQWKNTDTNILNTMTYYQVAANASHTYATLYTGSGGQNYYNMYIDGVDVTNSSQVNWTSDSVQVFAEVSNPVDYFAGTVALPCEFWRFQRYASGSWHSTSFSQGDMQNYTTYGGQIYGYQGQSFYTYDTRTS